MKEEDYDLEDLESQRNAYLGLRNIYKNRPDIIEKVEIMLKTEKGADWILNNSKEFKLPKLQRKVLEIALRYWERTLKVN